MIPYRETPDEFRAQHLEGCTLAPDHAGACRLARPFRIRPEGGREYIDQGDAPEHVAGQLPLIDSCEAASAEVRWVASEARALTADPDPQRRAAFLARKRALLAYIDTTTGVRRCADHPQED